MRTYRLHKVDSNLYIQGLSGSLVYKGAALIGANLLLFVGLYIGAGTFTAVLICIPAFFVALWRLRQIQKDPGPAGWANKRVSRKLPAFIQIKKRICHYYPR